MERKTNRKRTNDLRLIEAGFPCHQVGAETQRERGASSALPPLYFLHVWWARRPLTPSRAAILASFLPADTDPDCFLRQLGIKKRVVEINGQKWTLTGKILERVKRRDDGEEVLEVDSRVLQFLRKEIDRRAESREIIARLKSQDPSLANDPVLMRWEQDSQPIPDPWPKKGEVLPVISKAADPWWFKNLMAVTGAYGVRVPNLYGYDRAYLSHPDNTEKSLTVLDPTAGGGSIPFEALRLGHKVVANELNPVASVILHATVDYPFRFGLDLVSQLRAWGEKLIAILDERLREYFPSKHKLPDFELNVLKGHLRRQPDLVEKFDEENTTTYLYCRQVTCPHCGGEAPLLNTCWLSKEVGKQWGVKIVTDGKGQNGKVRFETYRVSGGRGPGGEDPNFATVNRGMGMCIHCRQAIDADEIKAQARGKSPVGRWKDRLYCVAAVRFQPKLDKNGTPQRYRSGEKAGEIKTEKIRFFRHPNRSDLSALEEADRRLKENWDRWEAEGLIPTERFPKGNDMRPLIYGMTRWCDMFTPRQLLGHVTLVEELNRLKPHIIEELGEEKGRAVVTYLQFIIDKGVDYNSRQTRWEYTRGIVKGTFGRHDYSMKWTFGEMIFTGPNSGAAWALNQILDAYRGMAELLSSGNLSDNSMVSITQGTAAHMPTIKEGAIDLICMDPPYYNNVQYAELSDYFYVWQKRTLGDLYPSYFTRRLTNKQDEAVANPDRDGGSANAKATYERMMGEIFRECRRVVKNDGLMTLMFTHKSQDAWETLTRSLIENGWSITASFPVESETQQGIHTKDTASAISSIFLSCRKRPSESKEPASWTGFGGSGVQKRIREAVREGLEEFKPLKLNPVDEMVASYGRALRVLSEHWPVMDGDEDVGPIRAMNEASRVVAENQIRRTTNGRLRVEDLSPEAAMALTLYGVYGLTEFPYDEALNLSRSLNIALESKTGGYPADGRFVGINTEAAAGRRTRRSAAEETGFFAPLVRRGSKLRLARPEERNRRRLAHPQTEWDLLHGLVMAYREGDIPVARGYLDRHGEGKEELVLDILDVWAEEMTDENLQKEARAMVFGLR
ncbi:MAG: DUF1156 domain-containing protein [Deltaproteobacteria bacterium]|nr:DUF1156 domain-containing protein [Deltaproteobacteria bacterium]